MTQAQTGWHVLDERVWLYAYAFSKSGSANCLAVRARDGTVVVLSPALGVSDLEFAQLAQLGDVTALVATNGHHHLGLAEFRRRFPAADGYAPSLAAARIHKKNPGAGELQPLSALQTRLAGVQPEPDLVIREAPGTRSGELWAFVSCASGYVWFASDILANIETLPSALIPRLILQLSGSGPGFRVFHAALALMVKDKPAMLRAFLEDVRAHPPWVVVPAHGAPVAGSDAADRTLSLLEAALA